MSIKRAKQRSEGDVVAIPLGDGRYAFGWVLEEPLVAVFDLVTSDKAPSLESVLQHHILFKVWVMNYAFTKGMWPAIGHKELGERERIKPWFFKEDPISKRLSITQGGFDPEAPASLEDVAGPRARIRVESRARGGPSQ